MAEATTLLEHRWSSVRLGGSSGAVGPVSHQNERLSWINNYVSLEGDRRSRLKKFDMMDRRSVEISKSLDIIAEDLSGSNADDKELFLVEYDEDEKVLKTHKKLLSTMIRKWSQRNSFETTLFDYGRELFKYGGVFFLRNPDGTLKKISPEKLVGYILSPDDDNIVTHYLVDWDAAYLDIKENHRTVEKIDRVATQRVIEHIPVEDMVIFKRGSTPFGESLLERAYPIWRKLDLLETAIVLLRFTRSVDRRAFYIDVGRLPPKKHKEVIDKYRSQMNQKRVIGRDGDIDTEFDPHSMTEDFYLPVTSQGRSSRVEMLQGSSNPGDLVDLTYFARKLAAAMRVPPSFTDTHNEGHDRDNYSDMRVGQLYQIEMRYLGFINRDKMKVAERLFEHFKWFCKQRDVEVPESMCLRLTESHNFALYKNAETNQALLNVYQSASQENSISKRFKMQKFLGLTDDEMLENEILVLEEKGLNQDQIKKLPEEAVANIVYGDGSLGKEYGIKASEDGSGGYGY